MNFPEIAAIVQFHRKKAGLSRNQLADLADVGKTVVFDIEHSKETVQCQSLAKVLATLNIRVTFDSPLMAEFHASQIQSEK